MKVLVATTAGAGHVAGLLPFAAAAARAGHEVRVAAPASFAPTVEGAGFAHERLGDADPAVLGSVFGRLASLTRAQANAVVLSEVFGRIDTAAALPAMREVVARWQPDVVLREPAELSSYVAAQEAGVPLVQCNIGLDRFDDQLLPHVEEPLHELGQSTEGLRTAPRWTVVPPGFDERADDAAGPLTAAREPATAVARGGLPSPWGRAEDPLVYVTFGSVTAAMGLFPGVYRAVLEQLADLPVRVLMTLGTQGDPEALGTLPDSVRVERWWPMADVLPHAELVLGHGGFGTTQAALVAGVPQVVLPLFASDQFLNAARVQAVGVGRAVVAPDAADLPSAAVFPDGPEATGQVGDAVREVLAGPRWRDRARGLAAEVQALPTTDDVVATLPALVG